jgi:hypothetical protein
MKIILISILLLLIGCMGPTLFTVNGFKITASDVITMPHKIETLINKREK